MGIDPSTVVWDSPPQEAEIKWDEPPAEPKSDTAFLDAVTARTKGILRGELLTPEQEKFTRQTLNAAASGPISGVVQLAAKALGAEGVANAIEAKKNDSNIAGAFLQPEGWLLGNSIVGRLFSGEMNLGQKAATAAGTSGAYAWLSPNDLAERNKAAAITASVAAGLPVVGQAVQRLGPMASKMMDAFRAIYSQRGREAVGRNMVFNQLPPAEREAALAILDHEARTRSPQSQLGVDLTTGETLARARIDNQQASPAGAGWAALEAALSKMRGGETLRNAAERRANTAGEIVGTLSGGRGAAIDPLTLQSADDAAQVGRVAYRQATANRLYPPGTVRGDAELAEIMSRPGVQRATQIENTTAANVPRATQIGAFQPASTQHAPFFNEWQQTPFQTTTPAQYPDYTIRTLANRYRELREEARALLRSADEGDRLRGRELDTARRDLGQWLGARSGDWTQANRFFGAQSVPITRAEAGMGMKRAWEQSPEAFTRITQNTGEQERLLQQITGYPRGSFNGLFNLGERSRIAALTEDANISQEVRKLETMVNPDMRGEKAFQLPNLLNVWVAVANKLARTTAEVAKSEVTDAAARLLQNPAELQRFMRKELASRAAARGPLSQNIANRIATGGLLTGAVSAEGVRK